MKEFTTLMLLFVSMTIMAQTRAGDSSPKEPQGATYTLSDGSTVTKTGENINSETQYYNVVQVTKGSLTLDGCKDYGIDIRRRPKGKSTRRSQVKKQAASTTGCCLLLF